MPVTKKELLERFNPEDIYNRIDKGLEEQYKGDNKIYFSFDCTKVKVSSAKLLQILKTAYPDWGIVIREDAAKLTEGDFLVTFS